MRYALGIEYDGSSYLGWQRLAHGATVQAAIEKALSRVADHPVDVVCAGRTDTGVHATCQVVHFDSHAVRGSRAWVMGCNSLLPETVAVLWAQSVEPGFHARYAARARCYRYEILNRPVRAALHARYVTWERPLLDAERMHSAAQALLGEHDFSAFRTSRCQALHPRRVLQQISVVRHGERVTLDVQANAFLHHMVRNIVGSLLLIGRGEKPVEWMAELLAGCNRDRAGPTARPNGLSFLGPRYPREWGLPEEVTLNTTIADAEANQTATGDSSDESDTSDANE